MKSDILSVPNVGQLSNRLFASVLSKLSDCLSGFCRRSTVWLLSLSKESQSFYPRPVYMYVYISCLIVCLIVCLVFFVVLKLSDGIFDSIVGQSADDCLLKVNCLMFYTSLF